MPEGDPVVDMIDVRLRSSSLSRRGSPLTLSRGGSLQFAGPGFGFSPAQTGQNTHLFGEDFAFDGKKAAPMSIVHLPQCDRSRKCPRS
jgi:hypothetical protein